MAKFRSSTTGLCGLRLARVQHCDAMLRVRACECAYARAAVLLHKPLMRPEAPQMCSASAQALAKAGLLTRFACMHMYDDMLHE